MAYLGHQLILDLFLCKNESINSPTDVEYALLKAAKIMGLTVVNSTIHRFNPIGVSGVVVIEESHISVHTWPEHEYIAIDIFTCGEQPKLEEGLDFLINFFGCEKHKVQTIKRGELKFIKGNGNYV